MFFYESLYSYIYHHTIFNNFLEITFSESATAWATSAPNELKICQFVNLIGFELHCFPSRLIFRTRTYMYYIYIQIRIYKMFGTFCHLSARQQMGSSCVQNFTFVGFWYCNQYKRGVPLLSHYHINSAMRDWERHFLKYLHFYLFSASAYNSLPSPTWQSSVWTFWLWSLRAGALFEQDASEVEVLEVEVELRYADAAIPESRNF